MCGIPSSGKSTRAEELGTFLRENRQVQTHMINDDISPNFSRNLTFKEEKREKEIRGQLRSEVQKRLNQTDVVILDAANYIKGYRYELYCLSKANKTTYCVIECIISQEKAWAFNLKKEDEFQYSQDVFDGLCMRYEAPDSRNRWDSPLFSLQPEDALPGEAISDALLARKAPPANQATQSQPLLSTNFLYDMDRTTQNIVRAVLEAQKLCGPGDEVAILDSKVKLKLSHIYTGMELARLRRQFLVYVKMHPVDDEVKLSNMFIQYLNGGMCL